MNTDYDFNLMQLSDSFFPSGMFSMSGGFESWSKYHKVKDANGVKEFILQQLCFQIVPLDCLVLKDTIQAYQNSDLNRVVHNDNFYFSTKLVKEARTAVVRSGMQVIDCISQMDLDKDVKEPLQKFKEKIKQKKANGTYPVAIALASCCLGIPLKSAIQLMIYSFCAGVVGSAIRLAVIGHIDGQKILFGLSREVENMIKDLDSKTISDVWQLVPSTEILQMNHENDESKMFIT